MKSALIDSLARRGLQHGTVGRRPQAFACSLLAVALIAALAGTAQAQLPSALFTWPGTGDVQLWTKNFGTNTATFQNTIAGELTIIENGAAGTDLAVRKDHNRTREGVAAGGGLDVTGLDWMEFDLGHNGSGPIDVQFYVQATSAYNYRALGPDISVLPGMNTYRVPLTGLTLDEALYIRPFGFNARTHTEVGNVTWTLREVRTGGTPRLVRDLITHDAGTPEGGLQGAIVNFGNAAVQGNDGGQNQTGLSWNAEGSGTLRWTDLGAASGGAAISWGNGLAWNGNTFNNRPTDLSGYTDMIVRMRATDPNAANPIASLGVQGFFQNDNFATFQTAGAPQLRADGLWHNLRYPLSAITKMEVVDQFGLQLFDHANDLIIDIDNIRFQRVQQVAHTLFSWEGGFEGWTQGPDAGHVHSLVSTGATLGASALQIDRRSVPGNGGDPATDAFVPGSTFITTNAATIQDLTSRINNATKIAFDVTFRDEGVVPAPTFTNFYVELDDNSGAVYRAATVGFNVNAAFDPVTMALELPIDSFFDTTAGSTKNLAVEKLATNASEFSITIISNTNGGSLYQIDNLRVVSDVFDLSADFNENAIVNAADLDEWKSAYGVTHAGDADGDGDADGTDFLIWQRQFGGPGQLPAAGTVPEPAAGAMALLAAALLASRRKSQ